MQRAQASGVPFWPAASILDIPDVVLNWQDIYAEAYAKAQPELERVRKIMTAQPQAHAYLHQSPSTTLPMRRIN